MITTTHLHDSQRLPLVIEPASADLDPAGWAKEQRPWIEEQLLAAAAILFRNFRIPSPADFQAFVQAVADTPLEYRERSSPRSQVLVNIYTSTDYPPQYSIFVHSESSYAATWPAKLFFYCDVPAAEGGATPVADIRRIYQRIPPAARQKFIDKKVMYVRNFGRGLGLPWTTVFQTTDRAEVERYCRQAGIEVEWRDNDRLRTRHVRPAVQRHPRTGEPVWFNHATFFHVSTLEPAFRDVLLKSYAADDLPNNTFYGDGSPIEPEVLDELRTIYREETVSFPWQRGDVLLLDNMLTAHGRAPYRGARRILVAMAQPLSDDGSREVALAGVNATNPEATGRSESG